jgi:hypothetical protein
MIGDAYFQLRAQVGTALFSLQRLATEVGTRESTQAALRISQAGLRESFTFAALGPEGGGKSALLNTLFERDFGGAIEPASAGKVAVFHFADEARDEALSPAVVALHRPHIFLRDFTIVEAPGGIPVEVVNSHLIEADLIFYVVSAAASSAEIWPFLAQLGRDVLRRLIFVVWQSDRVSPEEGANSVKRLRQAMLKNIGQACPIFIGSKTDRAAREKLVRWIETEVIFSEPRRARLREIDEIARGALREIVDKPRADREARERQHEQVRGLRDDLIEREEQAERQVAGSLWTLAQSTDGLRRRGEMLLREQLGPFDLLWKRSFAPHEFASEIETQARASLAVQLRDHLVELEADLRESAEEYYRESRELVPAEGKTKPPEFPRESLQEVLTALEPPLEVSRLMLQAFTAAVRTLQLPAFAALVAVAVAVGTAAAGETSVFLISLAAGSLVFVLLLAFLLRRNVIATLGRNFTENRASLVAVLEPPLREAIALYYEGIAPALDARAEQLAGEGQRNEPLLERLTQIEETFTRLEANLRTGLSREEG